MRFCNDFWTILGPSWGPCGVPFGLRDATGTPPRRSKTLSRRSQDAPKTLKDANKAPQDAPRGPNTPPCSILDDFSLNPTSPFGASSGLEALSPHFPHPQIPLGRDLPLPYPSPWSPSLPGQTWAGLLWRPRAFPEAIQKCFIFFIDVWTHFGSILEAQTPPKSRKI